MKNIYVIQSEISLLKTCVKSKGCYLFSWTNRKQKFIKTRSLRVFIIAEQKGTYIFSKITNKPESR